MTGSRGAGGAPGPSPTPAIVAATEPGGVYETCEQLAGSESDSLSARLWAAPDVSVHAHVDGPRIMEATRRAPARAGYSFRRCEVRRCASR